MRKSILSFIVAGALIIGFSACNNPSQPYIKFRSGKHLHIDGPATVTVQSNSSVTEEYSVRNGTIKKTYKWSVSGDAKIDSTYMYKDLKAAVTFPGTAGITDTTVYTDSVMVDDGTHTGSLGVTVTVVP